MQPEGLVKLKTRVEARADFSRCEDAGSEGGTERKLYIVHDICNVCWFNFDASHARVAADVRCHLVGNCYRFKLIEQYARTNRLLIRSFSLGLSFLHSQFNNT